MMRPILAIPAILLCAGCATIPNVDDLVVAEPVNCETARRDLIALDQMRPTAEGSAMVFLSTVTPGGIIAGLMANDMADRGRIFDGSFKREVEAKEAAIRATCDLPRATDPVDPLRPDARDMKKASPEGEAVMSDLGASGR